MDPIRHGVHFIGHILKLKICRFLLDVEVVCQAMIPETSLIRQTMSGTLIGKIVILLLALK